MAEGLIIPQLPATADTSACKPVPGSLFVVGDPKQSIYRFRRADIVTYNRVKEIIASTGGRVVFSGLLASDADEVLPSLTAAGLAAAGAREAGDANGDRWIALLMKR